MKRLEVEKYKKFGSLTYLGDKTETLPGGQKVRIAKVLCDHCHKTKKVFLLHLLRNRAICSCLQATPAERKTRLYNSWRGMLNRVKETYFQKQYYSEKGIIVYEPWKHFRNFKKWAMRNGYKSSLTIDRKENDKGYFPDNCRWITQLQNNLNQDRLKFKNK